MNLNFKKFFLVAFAIIVIVELTLRLTLSERLAISRKPLCYTPDSLFGYSYIPNSEGVLRAPGLNRKFRINNQGFYGPDFNNNKEAGVFRICVVGNSLSNGIWTDGCNDFTIYLQEILDTTTFNRTEVINCSIDGGRRFLQKVNMAYYVAEKYNPDLILFTITSDTKWRFYARQNYCGYQIRYTTLSEQAMLYSKDCIDKLNSFKFKLIDKIYSSFYTSRVVFRNLVYKEKATSKFRQDILTLLKRFDDSDNQIAYYFTLQTFENLLNKLNKDLDSCGTKLMFLDFGYDKEMRSIAEANQLNMLSLKMNLSKYELKYDGHPSQEGHKAIAIKLFDLIKKENLIPVRP